MPSGRLRVGTSGWSYGWGEFYPADVPSRDRLAFYSRHFGTVEVNTSFYRLPRPPTYLKWAGQTPGDFVFALKAGRSITHSKRLTGVKDAWRAFLRNASALGAKLGPVLLQLPPGFGADAARLERFLTQSEALKQELRLPALRLALEARHASWFESAEVPRTLHAHGACLVFAHSSRYPYPGQEPVTAAFVYLRFHGPRQLFASLYGARGLEPWVAKGRRWLRQGLDVYAYFNNDVEGYAVRDASTLRGLIEA